MRNILVNPTRRCLRCGKLSKTNLCDACRKPKKIKIIDLYNMIADCEELPESFEYDNAIWDKYIYNTSSDKFIYVDYYCEALHVDFSTFVDTGMLNDEIIITAEKCKEYKIPEKLRLSSHIGGTFESEQEYRNKRDDEITEKINSIIDCLKNKGNE